MEGISVPIGMEHRADGSEEVVEQLGALLWVALSGGNKLSRYISTWSKTSYHKAPGVLSHRLSYLDMEVPPSVSDRVATISMSGSDGTIWWV